MFVTQHGPSHRARHARAKATGNHVNLLRTSVLWLALGLALATAIAVIGPTAGSSRPDSVQGARSSSSEPKALQDVEKSAQLEAETLPAPVVGSSRPIPASTPAQQVTASSASITTLAANGIPQVAAAAYQSAARSIAVLEPFCHLPWTLLAAIGGVESNHGRFAGAVLGADGTSTPPIIGPALNGVGTALIAATTFGVTLDGDRLYDHAVGPMQFIPSTWQRYGSAAPGHVNADPFNIADAALTAAKYLCAAGGDLSALAGQQHGVFAYNHSDTYVATVLALETAYAAGDQRLAPPTGSGPPLAAVAIPPANPGPPLTLATAPTTTSSTVTGSSESTPSPTTATNPPPASSTPSTPTTCAVPDPSSPPPMSPGSSVTSTAPMPASPPAPAGKTSDPSSAVTAPPVTRC